MNVESHTLKARNSETTLQRRFPEWLKLLRTITVINELQQGALLQLAEEAPFSSKVSMVLWLKGPAGNTLFSQPFMESNVIAPVLYPEDQFPIVTSAIRKVDLKAAMCGGWLTIAQLGHLWRAFDIDVVLRLAPAI